MITDPVRLRATASQARGSTSFSQAVTISDYLAAACQPTRARPANSRDFPRSAIRHVP